MLAFYTHSTMNSPTSRDFENTMIFQKCFRETSSFCLLEMLIFHSHSMATLISFGGKKSEIAQSSIFLFSWNVKKRKRWVHGFQPIS